MLQQNATELNMLKTAASENDKYKFCVVVVVVLWDILGNDNN